MKLSESKCNQKVRVVEILLNEEKKKRLYYLGIYVGCTLMKIQKAPFHDPSIYQIDQVFLVLREEDTSKILVEEVV